MKTENGASSVLRAGIIGAGLMGYWHAHAINKSGAKIAAVVDLDIDEANKLAKRYREAKVYSNPQEMMEDADIDVVHICTPLSTHKEFSEMALEKGIHVMVEKPMTSNSAETKQLFNLAEEKNLYICPVHQFVFQDGVRKATENLPSIGKLVHLESTICSAGGVGQEDAALDTIVADILPHPLSLFLALLPQSIEGKEWEVIKPSSGELRAITTVGDVTLSIFISMKGRPTECSMKIIGQNGVIYLDCFHGFSYKVDGQVSKFNKIINPFKTAAKNLIFAAMNMGKRAINNEPAYPGLSLLISRFYKAIQSKTDPPFGKDDVIKVAELRDKIIEKMKGIG